MAFGWGRQKRTRCGAAGVRLVRLRTSRNLWRGRGCRGGIGDSSFFTSTQECQITKEVRSAVRNLGLRCTRGAIVNDLLLACFDHLSRLDAQDASRTFNLAYL